MNATVILLQAREPKNKEVRGQSVGCRQPASYCLPCLFPKCSSGASLNLHLQQTPPTAPGHAHHTQSQLLSLNSAPTLTPPWDEHLAGTWYEGWFYSEVGTSSHHLISLLPHSLPKQAAPTRRMKSMFLPWGILWVSMTTPPYPTCAGTGLLLCTTSTSKAPGAT